MPRHLTSYISVRRFEAGNQDTGKYDDSRKPRSTEISALDRIAFGDGQAATNNAAKLYDPEYIPCSVCGHKKHYLDFNRDSRMTWRFNRRYDCQRCQSLENVDQYARRKKRHARSKVAAV